jgi:hypothetical protein
MFRIFLPVLLFFTIHASAQYNWKLEKEKNGIKIFISEIPNSSFKAVKVECTIKGTYNKLISLLTDVKGFEDWIYNNKRSVLIKKNSPLDFIYYSETHMPWPISNRDAVIHLRIRTDSLPKFLFITGDSEPGLLPEVPARVRVPYYTARWKVTMPAAGTLRIFYTVEFDPGGNIPAWAANMFADKGPYGSFSKLAEKLGE